MKIITNKIDGMYKGFISGSVIDKTKLDRVILFSLLKNISIIKTNIGELSLKDTCGEGGTAIVKRAVSNEGTEYAIKFIVEDIKKHESKNYLRIKQSYNNLIKIQNDLPIVRLFDLGSIKLKKYMVPYLIMPYMDQTLYKYVNDNRNNITFDKYNCLASKLFDAVDKLHQNKIIHRDIKPQNIFIENNDILFGDLDIMKYNAIEGDVIVETMVGDRIGNYLFSAPEQSQPELGNICEASDWYAVGQVLYWIIRKSTIRGTRPDSLGCGFEKYDKLIEKLVRQKPNDRLNSKKEIFEYMIEKKKV